MRQDLLAWFKKHGDTFQKPVLNVNEADYTPGESAFQRINEQLKSPSYSAGNSISDQDFIESPSSALTFRRNEPGSKDQVMGYYNQSRQGGNDKADGVMRSMLESWDNPTFNPGNLDQNERDAQARDAYLNRKRNFGPKATP